jgi:hypothetical protein
MSLASPASAKEIDAKLIASSRAIQSSSSGLAFSEPALFLL